MSVVVQFDEKSSNVDGVSPGHGNKAHAHHHVPDEEEEREQQLKEIEATTDGNGNLNWKKAWVGLSYISKNMTIDPKLDERKRSITY